ncbi:MAG: hypothetical protein OM95_04245 [Bdellovibrio sp. ArHS]|uniref:hypothetical protein n=1 Tax=Bdellovibrio sp. ArHS TaxID=1569284 RepID=UPI00058336FB|nr:hypothetical protein [Bdellovibrio sp. ArHS]KHD89343.1 MAG: hypothetical protein OM95_04245 [Bdellovibrio sp. ArHS]
MKSGIAVLLGFSLMLPGTTALAQLVRCEAVFANTNASSGHSYSAWEKALNYLYLMKRPQVLKQLDVNEYNHYLTLLRAHRTDVPASQVEHYIAILDHHREFVGVEFHQLPLLTQKKIATELKSYQLTNAHDPKEMVQFVNTLTDGTMQKPTTLFRVYELLRQDGRKAILLKQYSEQFLLMNVIHDLFTSYGRKPPLDEAKFSHLRQWYRRNSEYVGAGLMSSLQLALNIVDPGGVYLSGINLTKIESFRSRVEIGLRKNLSLEQMLSSDKYLRDMVRSDLEYRVVQSTVNATFWLSLIYFLFSEE